MREGVNNVFKLMINNKRGTADDLAPALDVLLDERVGQGAVEARIYLLPD